MANSQAAASMTQAAAWERFDKLLHRINVAPCSDDHSKRFITVAGTVLKTHKIDESSSTAQCQVDTAEEVTETIRDLLDGPSTVFGDAFFTNAFYPVRLLYEVATFYGAQSVPAKTYERLGLSSSERTDKKVTRTVWLCHILDMGPSDIFSIRSELKSSRTLTGIGTQSAEAAATATIAPAVDTTQADTARAGDTEPVTEPDTNGSSRRIGMPTASDKNVDTGRQRRYENLHNRDRAADASQSDRISAMKQSSYVSYHFSNKQFTGDLSQFIAHTLRDYHYCAQTYDLDDAAMARNFASALNDPARSFFLANWKQGMSFKEVEDFMLAEYNSASRQIQVQRLLQSLTITGIMSDKGLSSEQDALTSAINTIDALVPQCPPEFRSDANKTSFLRQAVLRRKWAEHPIAKADTGKFSWREFTTELHAAFSLSREREEVSPTPTHVTTEDFQDLFNTHMTRYGKNPRFNRKHDRPSSSSRDRSKHQSRSSTSTEKGTMSFEEALRKKLCVKCKNPWKPGHRCDGRNVRNHVFDRMRRGDHHTHIIADMASFIESTAEKDDVEEHGNTEGGEQWDTHVVEEQINDIESLMDGGIPDADEQDAEWATHYVAAAFPAATLSRTSPLEPHTTRDSPKPCAVQERREFVTYASRTYLSSEAKRFTKPGFLVDIGAPKSVSGRKALNRMISASGTYHLPSLRKSTNNFRFADEVYNSIGIVTLFLATPHGVDPIAVDIDIVVADIPPLLGLDVIERERLTPDVAFNVLAKRTRAVQGDGKTVYVEDWSIPMWRSKSRHSYVPLRVATPTHFTRAQLHKLHRQFFHPSAEKLYNLLKRSCPEDTTPETLNVLQDITKRCIPCQKIRRGPTRFRVSLGAEDVRFNERVLMDIMYLGQTPVLHVVDEQTKFSAAAFLPSVSTNDVWLTFLKCWANIYTGLPNRMMVDQGSQFGKSPLFASLAETSNVELQTTGIEAHSSLGLGERYHQPLRNTYRKLLECYPSQDKAFLLQCAVKGMNDTLGPEGLVPSVLVFGEYPPAYTKSESKPSRPTADQRSKIAHDARLEMSRQMAKVRVARALRHAVPTAADEVFAPGESVLVWREKVINNRIGQWLGPFMVDSFDPEKKLVFVRQDDDAVKPFGLVQVRRYYPPEETSSTFLSELNDCLSYFREPVIETFPTEVVQPGDPRATSGEMKAAKKKEVEGLFRRGTLKVIMREDVPPNANVLPGRFVVTIKSTEDGTEKYKARFEMGGHRDKHKYLMVHNASTLQPQSIRLLLTLARAHDFDIWTAEVTQAYLQSTDPLLCDIYITKDVPEFELAPEQ